jgi:glycosyltransferase involved in cell wall biosynthesis
MKDPRVTVLMPVYDGGPYLAAAVASIRQQSFSDFEFLIINDGSVDGSGDLLDSQSKEDSRIRVIHQSNRGLVATLNRGLDEAKAPLIARMDCDDVALPDRLGLQVSRFEADRDLGLLGGHLQIVDGADRVVSGRIIRFPVGKQAVAESLYYGSPVAHPAAMMRRDLVRELGGYREFFKHCEDYDLWLRLSERARIDNLDQVILHYRQHGDNISARHRETQITGTYLAQAAWLMRRDMGLDPVSNWTGLDRDLLLGLPLSRSVKNGLLSRWTLAMIDHLPAGELDRGEVLLSDLVSQPGMVRAEIRRDVARMHAKLSQKAAAAKSWGKAVAHAGVAARWDFKYVARQLWNRL